MLRLFFLICFIVSVALHSRANAAQSITIDGSTGVKPLIESLAQVFQKTSQAVQIKIGPGLKPNLRLQALLDEKIDIAMASHGIDIEQISARGFKVHKIARVAVVFGANHSVKVMSLSQRQLCDIYSGKVSNWQALKGSNLQLTPFIRPYNEVDYEVVNAHISCFSQLQIPGHIQIRKKSGQMAKAIAQTPGAIGMTTMIRVVQSKGKVRALSLNEVAPDTANLSSGAYSLTRGMYLITASQLSPEVERFLAFITSKEGKDIIVSNHAVPTED